jgi:predicted ATPase/transcriptional regulator with XRE-family HTH domain
MKRSYRDRDYSFGQMILNLRSAIGLTQAGLAEHLGISRFAIGEWEVGNKYPKVERLKVFIELAVQQGAFPAGYEADNIRDLWKAAHQKALLDENWLAGLLESKSNVENDNKLLSIRKAATKQNRINNLPFQAKPLIGRTIELSKIAQILNDPACRLLTLIGPGGIGKTRLALEIAARQVDTFDDGAAFVALASVDTIDQIISSISDALRFSFGGQIDPRKYLLNNLQERHLLLVLDNFEHLLNDVGLINDILQHAPNVTILVTSRSRLNLQSEWLFDVEGLSYPSREIPVNLQTMTYLAEYSAVQLFVQRATQVQPHFSLSEKTLKSIVLMIQQLAGIPLAIELAAAAVRTHSIDMIQQQIRENLNLFSTTLRDIPERHRSMRAAFDHSWSLLDETERRLFSRLAIFHGSFTAEAANQVAGAALFNIGTLIDKSLLRQSIAEPYASESRFIMLEPIRENAMEMLLERGEYEKLQHTHATYYVTLAENAGAHWYTQTAEIAIRQLSTEYDNLYTALVWSKANNYPTIGLQIAVALTPLWKIRCFLNEGSEWLADLLKLDADTHEATSLSVRVRALKCAARLATDKFDFAEAAKLLKESLAIRHTLGETGSETRLLINATLQARSVGEYQRATVLIEDALAEHYARGERGGVAECLYILALVLREQGQLDRALALTRQRLEIDDEIGDPGNKAQALLALGDIARDRGDVAQTRKYSTESLAIYREYGMQWAIGFALNNLAYAAYMEGDITQAFSLASESVSLFQGINRGTGIVETLVTLGYVLLAQGKMAAADEAMTEVLRLALVHGPRLFVASALEGLASMMAQTQKNTSAVRFLSAVAALRTQMGTPIRLVDKPMLEQTYVTLRAAIGEDAFETLWAESQLLELDEIVKEALANRMQ